VRRFLVGVAIAVSAFSVSCESEPRVQPGANPPSTSPVGPSTSRFPSFDDADALAASRPVRFRGADGVRLEGRLFGSGDVGVVLSHMRPGTQSQWLEFAALLADRGFRVLTFNRRGTCPGGELGCSAGTGTGEDWRDLAFAVDVVRRAGADRVVVGGASLGAMESLFALSRGLDADGLVWVSGFDFYGLVPATAQVRRVDVPKLFVAGEGDADAAGLLPELDRAASPPATVLTLETGEHGTDILAFADPDIADELREAILDFLSGI
jgi:pimeloyl-ACP methyl ester carboxylesterase